MSDGSTVEGDTYEMLWDCAFCRTPKLLGLTHRYCPVCGAPQNAAERYFPSDEDKVAVANHQYFGRDRVCEHCNTFNSRNSQHCRDCGAPLESSKDAPERSESNAQGLLTRSNDQTPQTFSKNASPRRSRVAQVVWLVLGSLVVTIGVFFFWKRDATFEVAGHNWERTVDIERFGPVRESAWCDQLPAAARELGRHREVRSHEQVRDGETCSWRKVDQGDGTFREVKQCEPRYTSREIYDTKCDYEVNKWSKIRSAERTGQSLVSVPEWPTMNLAAACGNRVGCERQGAKHETYQLTLKAPSGSIETCDLTQEQWSQAALGQHYVAKVRVIGGGVDCATLTPH
jgi:ribosomal protein L40E